MNKIYVLILVFLSLFFLSASINPTKAGFIITTTYKKAIEQGWMKLYVPFGESDPVSACTIRQPSNAEVTSLIEFCKTNETSWTFEGSSNCEYHIRDGMMKDLCIHHKDAASYLKLTYTPIVTHTPTPTLTVIPTITLTITPTPTPVNVTNYKIAKSLYFNKKIGDMSFNELVGMIKQLLISLLRFNR